MGERASGGGGDGEILAEVVGGPGLSIEEEPAIEGRGAGFVLGPEPVKDTIEEEGFEVAMEAFGGSGGSAEDGACEEGGAEVSGGFAEPAIERVGPRGLQSDRGEVTGQAAVVASELFDGAVFLEIV